MYRAHSFKTVSMPFSYVVVCGDTLAPPHHPLNSPTTLQQPPTHCPLSMGC